MKKKPTIHHISRQLLTLSLCVIAKPCLGGPSLSVDQYLQEIKRNNQEIGNLSKQKESQESKKVQAELPFLPKFTSTATYLTDQKKTMTPAAQGKRTLVEGLTFGVQKQTEFGLKGGISYDIKAMQLQGTNPVMMSNERFIEAAPSVELSQSLMRNGFGSEVKAQKELVLTQIAAENEGTKFKEKALLLEGEMTYWRLAIAREVVRIQSKTLERSQELKRWAEKQWNQQLADRGDMLAASTAYTMRQLDKESAQVDERAAAAAFNRLRQINDEDVKESLTTPTLDFALNLKSPTRNKTREDIVAQELALKATQIGTNLLDESFAPELEVFGKFALNGREKKFFESTGEAFTSQYPTTMIGIRLNSILGGDIVRKQKFAASLDLEAKRLGLERKKFEVDQEWAELERKMGDAKKRLKLSAQLEKALAEKLSYEKSRQQIGRSTTFQVLSFEQEYLLSQLSQIRYIMEIIQLSSQMHLFAEGVNS